MNYIRHQEFWFRNQPGFNSEIEIEIENSKDTKIIS